MKTLKAREAMRLLQEAGFVLLRVNGSHHTYEHVASQTILVLAVHSRNDDLKPYQVSQLMRAIERSKS